MDKLKNILKNQDTNYISGIMVAILSVIISHKYINVHPIFSNSLVSLVFLLIIICIAKINIYLGLILTVFFLILNTYSQIKSFEGFADNEPETSEDEDDEEDEDDDEEDDEEDEDEDKDNNDNDDEDEDEEEEKSNTCGSRHKYNFKTGKKCKKSKENFEDDIDDNESTIKAFRTAKKNLTKQINTKKKKKSNN